MGLAQALIGSPPVLILDEPTVGLTPPRSWRYGGIIKSLGSEHTILLSTHILPEVSMVCDHVVIINGGRIVTQESMTSSRHREAVP